MPYSLAQIQDELASLYDYLGHNSVIDEREDISYLGLFELHGM